MVGLPKQFKKIAKKLDIRVHPDPELAKRFDKSCGRRYINVGLNMISFFHGVADKVNEPELKEYAKEVEESIYHSDGPNFEKYTNLYKKKLSDMGLWRSSKGISAYEKMKILNRLRKLGKVVKRQKNAEKNEKEKKQEPYRNRGDY